MDSKSSFREMAPVTPRRSARIPHIHTPKLSDRKKGLFQSELESTRESLTKHRKLPVVDSESDSEDCDLGIISTLDSSSDENDQGTPKTPERSLWHEKRSQSRKFLKENTDLKNFMKSPFTLKKYQNQCFSDGRCSGSVSTPVTPHLQNHPGTPSSTHSCTSVHTTSSSSSRARKSLASLIADTESCSSSLKDLNFDSDSNTSKENTPTKNVRRSKRTPKLNSFKGILLEQKLNEVSPKSKTTPTGFKNAVVCLTRMDMNPSPFRMQKTPQNTTETDSPPKLSHRRSVIEISESPESICDSEKSYKRLRNESISEGPAPKHPRIENAPKARLSLFNSDRLKEILSAKSFYGKSNPELNSNITNRISNAIEVSTNHPRKPFHTQVKRKRKPGQINMGVRHRIRKPKHKKVKYQNKNYSVNYMNGSMLNSTISSTTSKQADSSVASQDSTQDLGNDKLDRFDKEKQSIQALLSQWDEEEIPESELIYSKPKELPCFSNTIIEETHQIFQPITVVPVVATMPQDNGIIVDLEGKNVPQKQTITELVNPMTKTMAEKEKIISQSGMIIPKAMTLSQSELTLSQSEVTMSQNVVTISQSVVTMDGDTQDVVMSELNSHDNGRFLSVDGGYVLVAEDRITEQECLPDLDEIEREMRMLDEQILQMAHTNNMNAEAVLASTEVNVTDSSSTEAAPNKPKLFSIFSKPNPGVNTPTSKGDKTKKGIIKTGIDQYIIDAGQKKFGATQCAECGTIYQIGDPQDEHDHMVHHNATDVLKFKGWKDECVIEKTESWRCIRVRGGDPNWRRVDALLTRVVHPHLGYEGALHNRDLLSMTAYLCIVKKQIVGCLIAETKTKAYKLIPGDPDCCSVEHYPVKCGISRIWTHRDHRRRGVARRLLDCARASFLYGDVLRAHDLAFSAPTDKGKALAANYCGTDNFYVYLD